MRIDTNNGAVRRSLAVASMRRMGGELSQAANSVIMHNTKVSDLSVLERAAKRFAGQNGKQGEIKCAGVSFGFFGLHNGFFVGLSNDPIDKIVLSRLNDLYRNGGI